MTYYHGNPEKNFVPNPNRLGRYKFPCLFFSSSAEVARLFAGPSGALYFLDFPFRPDYVFDYNGELTYSSKFKKVITQSYELGHGSLLITNCYDFPAGPPVLIKSDLLVIFDFSRLKSFTEIK